MLQFFGVIRIKGSNILGWKRLTVNSQEKCYFQNGHFASLKFGYNIWFKKRRFYLNTSWSQLGFCYVFIHPIFGGRYLSNGRRMGKLFKYVSYDDVKPLYTKFQPNRRGSGTGSC